MYWDNMKPKWLSLALTRKWNFPVLVDGWHDRPFHPLLEATRKCYMNRNRNGGHFATTNQMLRQLPPIIILTIIYWECVGSRNRVKVKKEKNEAFLSYVNGCLDSTDGQQVNRWCSSYQIVWRFGSTYLAFFFGWGRVILHWQRAEEYLFFHERVEVIAMFRYNVLDCKL